MSEFYWIIIGMSVSFLLGSVIWFFLLRGFVMPWLKSRGGGVLVRVHRNNGTIVYRNAKVLPGGGISYKWLDKDHHIKSVPYGSLKRSIRVDTIDVTENDTAPFIFERIVEDLEEVPTGEVNDVAVMDEEGNILKNDKGEVVTKKSPVTQKQVVRRLFVGYDDSHILNNVIKWALMRPSKKLPGMGLDMKTVLIGLLVIGGGIYLIMMMSGSAPNVIS